MAKFSEQFIQGLLQPSYQKGLFTAAQQLGARPRQIAQEKAKRERLQGLLSGEGPLTQEDISGFIASGGDVKNIPVAQQLREGYDEPLREKGRGRLRAMAQMELFDPQDPGKLQGFLNVAERHKVSFNEAMQILAEERGTMVERAKIARTGSRAGTTTFASGGKYLDKRNLEYRLTEVRDPTGQGQTRTKYEPVGHEIPYAFSFEDEEGNSVENRLTEKGGAYGETAAQRTERFGTERKIQQRLDISEAQIIQESDNFSDLRSAAAQRLPVVESTLADVNDLLGIVEVIDQGGSLVPLMNTIERVLGTEETDPGKLRIIAKELLVGRIKSFGANPTEGERQYLEQLIPSLENAKGVNKALLNRLKERLGREKAAIQYMFTDDANLDGYVNYVNALYSADTGPNSQQTGNKRVRFDEIQ